MTSVNPLCHATTADHVQWPQEGVSVSPDFVDQLKRGLHRRSSIFWLHGGETTVTTGDIVAVGEDFVEIRGLVPTVEEVFQGHLQPRGEAQGSQLSTVIPLQNVCAVVKDVPAGQKAFPGATRVRIMDTAEPRTRVMETREPDVPPHGYYSDQLAEEEPPMISDESGEGPSRRRRGVRRRNGNHVGLGNPRRVPHRGPVRATLRPHRRALGQERQAPQLRHTRPPRAQAQAARRSPPPVSAALLDWLERLEKLEKSILREQSQRLRGRRASAKLKAPSPTEPRHVRAVRSRPVSFPPRRVPRLAPSAGRSHSRVLHVSGGSIPIRKRAAAAGPYGWL